MTIQYLIQGFIVGFLASVTLGPVGVMCIQRTLSKGRLSGLISGLGAAVADTIYAIAAFFFISLVGSFIEEHMTILTIIGGVCVGAVGTRIVMTNPVMQMRRNRNRKTDFWQDFISIFLLTFTNPAFIFWLIVLFSAFNLQYDPTAEEMTRVATGVLTIGGFMGGAVFWWYLLTSLISMLSRKFKPIHLLWINRITGSIIILLGLWAVISTLIELIKNGAL